MWKVKAVTRAASVPALAVAVAGVLVMVGSPWMSHSSFHRGCSSSILRSSVSLVAAASCFDTWLR